MTDKDQKPIDKSFVGKYVCFAKPDGSFTWGRIKDQGFTNSVKGEKEVFILTDQIVCRVANNPLELASIERIEHRLETGKAGPTLLAGPTDPDSLPSYQRFGDTKLLPEKAEEPKKEPDKPMPCGKCDETPRASIIAGETIWPSECSNCGEPLSVENKFLPVPLKEKQGLVPRLTGAMLNWSGTPKKSKGLPMMQKVGSVVSSVDGRNVKFVLRRYGYDTIVVKGSLNLKKDIVDGDDEIYDGMTDGEVFLMAMQAKLQGSETENIFGGKKPLALNEGKE